MTRPIFIIGSARSGTALLGQKLLPAMKGSAEIHHEFKCEQVAEIATLYYNAFISFDETCQRLKRLYGAALAYCEQDLFIDVSNKPAWLIAPLVELFPKARFVHLVRDGRKTVQSIYYKLEGECYDLWAVTTLQNWLASPLAKPMPPQEKPWWWPLPKHGDPYRADFLSLRWDRWQRICWYWGTINRVINRDLLACVPAPQRMQIKLEDLGETVTELAEFIELQWEKELFPLLKRPHNIGIKFEYPAWTEEQERWFVKLC